METRDTLFIGGEFVQPDSDELIEVISPMTEEVFGTVPHANQTDVDRAIAAAHVAAPGWAATDPKERGDIIAAISAGITARMDPLSKLITGEMGTPISFSQMGQVFASTMILDYYATLAREYEFETERQGLMTKRLLVRKEPIGVAAAIVPWNVPLFVTVLKLGPAFAAGVPVVLKPAPETPLDAYVLAEICKEAGLPDGVLNIVPAGREVGDYLVRHKDINKVGFTGSTVAGKAIAAACGEQLKPCTLELGGKSAAIILDDADLDSTIAGLIPTSIMNNGQACLAQTRLLVSKNRYDEVVDAYTAAAEALKVGDPFDPTTDVGPVVAKRQQDRILGYLEKGVEEGATLTTGGGKPEGFDKGWYVSPTVFKDVTPDMTIAREEIFGPAIVILPYDDEAHAIEIANDSDYGLSGSVWSADVDHAVDIARQVRTGHENINGFMLEGCAPFGGYKQSGLGREGGPEGMEAYLETKTINVL